MAAVAVKVSVMVVAFDCKTVEVFVDATGHVALPDTVIVALVRVTS